MATSNSLQEQRYTAPKVQPQANRNQMQPQANRNQMQPQANRNQIQPQANRNQIQPQANRNQIQPQGDAQSVPVSKSKVRLKKVYLWLRENFFPIISDNDSDSEDEEERQAIREERKLMKNPPIIKSELRLCNLKNQIPGLVGIYNHGNTCFISTVMQCLSNTEEFARYLVTDQYLTDLKECQKSKKKFGTRGDLTQQVANLLKSLWLGQYDNRISWYFMHTVMRHGEQYKGYMQHDAQEFLLWMLDNIHEDLLRVPQKGKKGIFSKSKISALPPQGLLGGQHQLIKSHNTIITQLFNGLFFSSISCKSCSKTSASLEPFLCLSLPIPQRQIRPLYVTIVKYTAPAVLNRKIGLTVPLICTAIDIKREIGERELVPVEYILLFEVYSDSYGRTVQDHDVVSEVQNRGDFLYAFILPKPEQSEGEFETISLICMNVYMYGHYPRRFTFPFIIQVARDIEVGEIENLVLQRLYAKTKTLGIELLEMVHRMFKIKMVDGMPGKTILSPYESKPLLTASAVKPLEKSITSGGQIYLRVLLEWENEIKSRVFGRYQEFSCDECVSVKSTQIFFRKAHKANLSDCFHLLTQREELCKGEEWYCSTCKGKKAGIKKLDLLDTPDVLVVHLKRFRQVGYLRQKLDTLIEYPLTGLDLSPFIINREAVEPYLVPAPPLVADTDSGSGKKKTTKKSKKQKIVSTPEPTQETAQQSGEFTDMVSADIQALSDGNISMCSRSTDLDSTTVSCSQVYDLYAVGNHHGGMTGGHYTAFCKNSISKKWYMMDDNYVQEINEKKVLTSNAYLLFYKRREVQTTPEHSNQSEGDVSPCLPHRDVLIGPDHWLQRFSVKIPQSEPDVNNSNTSKVTPPTPSHQPIGPPLRRANTAPPHKKRTEERHPSSFGKKKTDKSTNFTSSSVSVPTYNIATQSQAIAQTPSVPNFSKMEQSVPTGFTPPVDQFHPTPPIKKTYSQPNIHHGYLNSPDLRPRVFNESSV